MSVLIEASKQFLDSQLMTEAPKKGTVRYGEQGINHEVIHSKGKDHLTMSYHNEEPGSVAFHGKIKGHKIRVDSEGHNGGSPEVKHVKSDLKAAHPNLPDDVHKEVEKHLTAGIKKYHRDGGE